jgi:hypothetical protein
MSPDGEGVYQLDACFAPIDANLPSKDQNVVSRVSAATNPIIVFME